MNTTNKNKKTKTKKKKTGRFYIGMIVAFLLVIMSIQLANLYQKNEAYRQKEKAVLAEVQQQQESKENLKHDEYYTESQDNVKNTAKDKVGLVYDKEIGCKEKQKITQLNIEFETRYAFVPNISEITGLHLHKTQVFLSCFLTIDALRVSYCIWRSRWMIL